MLHIHLSVCLTILGFCRKGHVQISVKYDTPQYEHGACIYVGINNWHYRSELSVMLYTLYNLNQITQSNVFKAPAIMMLYWI